MINPKKIASLITEDPDIFVESSSADWPILASVLWKDRELQDERWYEAIVLAVDAGDKIKILSPWDSSGKAIYSETARTVADYLKSGADFNELNEFPNPLRDPSGKYTLADVGLGFGMAMLMDWQDDVLEGRVIQWKVLPPTDQEVAKAFDGQLQKLVVPDEPLPRDLGRALGEKPDAEGDEWKPDDWEPDYD